MGIPTNTVRIVNTNFFIVDYLMIKNLKNGIGTAKCYAVELREK
jgi:hypothetical protein